MVALGQILRQHKAICVAAGVLGVPLVGAGAFAAASHVVFGRSNISSVTELSLRAMDRRKKLADPLAFDNYVLAQAATNEARVDVPELVTFKCSVESEDLAGMQTFRLNRRDRNDRAVIYLHGGNFLRRPLSSQWRFCDTIARRTRAEVFCPMYPLAPVHTHADAFEALLALYEHVSSDYGARNVTLMGDGAGAGLAAAFAELLGRLGLEQPAHLILVSPWVDITLGNPRVDDYEAQDPLLAAYGLRKAGALWARGVDPHDPLVSPVNGDIRCLRNVMTIVGTRELLYPDARLFHDRVAAAGIHAELIEGRGLNHDFPLRPAPEATRAIERIVDAVTED